MPFLLSDGSTTHEKPDHNNDVQYGFHTKIPHIHNSFPAFPYL
jgi:hypothetical protein